jgi:hypothetical protein
VPGTRQTCADRGWNCGFDDYGNSCGTCSGTCTAGICQGGTTDHDLGSGTMPLFSTYAAHPFNVPVNALVSYGVSSGSSDTYNVGIFTSANWTIYSSGATGAMAWAYHANITMGGGSAMLPAGSYYLGFYCTNLVERCNVSYSVHAVY